MVSSSPGILWRTHNGVATETFCLPNNREKELSHRTNAKGSSLIDAAEPVSRSVSHSAAQSSQISDQSERASENTAFKLVEYPSHNQEPCTSAQASTVGTPKHGEAAVVEPTASLHQLTQGVTFGHLQAAEVAEVARDAIAVTSEGSKSTELICTPREAAADTQRPQCSPFFSDLRRNSEAFRYDFSPILQRPANSPLVVRKTEVQLFRESILSLNMMLTESTEQAPQQEVPSAVAAAPSEICAICGSDKVLVSVCTFTGKKHQLLSGCRLLRRSFPRIPDTPEVVQARRVLKI
jgi:hypothetical protein